MGPWEPIAQNSSLPDGGQVTQRNLEWAAEQSIGSELSEMYLLRCVAIIAVNDGMQCGVVGFPQLGLWPGLWDCICMQVKKVQTQSGGLKKKLKKKMLFGGTPTVKVSKGEKRRVKRGRQEGEMRRIGKFSIIPPAVIRESRCYVMSTYLRT
jgi:hypothetical protein